MFRNISKSPLTQGGYYELCTIIKFPKQHN